MLEDGGAVVTPEGTRAGDDGKRFPDAPSRICPDLESPVLSEAGSVGSGRSLGLTTRSLVVICKQHTLTLFFLIGTGEQRFVYSLGKLDCDLGSLAKKDGEALD